MRCAERGQATLAFGIILSAMLILTLGAIDGARAFYEYNAVSSAARDAARWAAVVGGTCADVSTGSGSWCNQFGQSASTSFWAQPGNAALQLNGDPCPDAPVTSSSYVSAGYAHTSVTTIVGAVVNHLDSNGSSPSVVRGGTTPGFELSRLRVCIELPDSWDAAKAMYIVKQGDHVGVVLYDSFYPVSPLLTNATLTLTASAQEEISWER